MDWLERGDGDTGTITGRTTVVMIGAFVVMIAGAAVCTAIPGCEEALLPGSDATGPGAAPSPVPAPEPPADAGIAR